MPIPLLMRYIQNGSSIRYRPLNSSIETMTVVVDGLALGVYSFSIEVVDIGGNIVSDEVKFYDFSIISIR